jgi:hypothetical protein
MRNAVPMKMKPLEKRLASLEDTPRSLEDTPRSLEKSLGKAWGRDPLLAE